MKRLRRCQRERKEGVGNERGGEQEEMDETSHKGMTQGESDSDHNHI